MAKQAGKKNDGAWYRANKWLKMLRSNPDNNAFIEGLENDPDLLDAASKVLGVQATLAGLSESAYSTIGASQGLPVTADTLLAKWIENGFPRQVWMGKLTYDRYTKVAPGGTYETSEGEKTNDTGHDLYIPANSVQFLKASKIIRKKIKGHMMVNRQLQDIANAFGRSHGNPGGIADATKLDALV